MRALILDAARSATVADVAAPEPAPGQVLISVDGCGICGSDLAVYEGRPWFSYPRDPGAPGHESWGTVVEVGPQAPAELRGQRVVALTYHGLAELDVADAETVVALPDEVEGPFPGEAVACAMNVFERSGIRAGDVVAVVGVGFLGAILVQLAAAAGARVIGMGRRQFALDVATRSGADEVVMLGRDDPQQAVQQVSAGAMCDVVIEATGYQGTLDVASDLVRVRGRLVIAGFHQDGMRTVNMQSWNWRGIDVINAHERENDVYVRGLRAAVEAVRSGTVDLGPLITHTTPLADAAAAFDLALARPDGFLKAVVQP